MCYARGNSISPAFDFRTGHFLAGEVAVCAAMCCLRTEPNLSHCHWTHEIKKQALLKPVLDFLRSRDKLQKNPPPQGIEPWPHA